MDLASEQLEKQGDRGSTDCSIRVLVWERREHRRKERTVNVGRDSVNGRKNFRIFRRISAGVLDMSAASDQ